MVQYASVKWNLAKDSNNSKLSNSAMHELIGHLSSENKDIYLEDAQPLQTYIDAKDEFDYKNNNYTTTQNVDTTPDENVRALQRELNERGYTDKFGQKLKEDGIYAGKTAYAHDSKIKNEKSSKYNDAYDVVALNKNGEPFESPSFASAGGPMLNPQAITDWQDGNSLKVASVTGTSNQSVLESVCGLKSNHLTSDGGNISPRDENRNQLKQTMIKCLSANWFRNDGNKNNQTKIENQADKYRDFDDNSFTKAVYMNKSDGVKILGHTGIMLINEDGFALIFSIYKDDTDEYTPKTGDAEMRFSVLTPNQVKRVLEGDGYIFSMSSSDGGVKTEYYDRFATFDINNGEGYNMYHHAVNIYNNPGDYGLFHRQCDDIACEILGKGGIDIKSRLWPNRTYDKIDDDTKSKNKRNSNI